MKTTLVVILLLIGVPVISNAASAADKCEVCGTSGGGTEMFASLNDGFGEECVDLTGNGFGFTKCVVYYVGTTTFCEGEGIPTCRKDGGDESLALITGVDGYLVAGRSETSGSEDAVPLGTVVRSCDGLILQRQFSAEQIAEYVEDTRSISL
jgi:hypothetical protein